MAFSLLKAIEMTDDSASDWRCNNNLVTGDNDNEAPLKLLFSFYCLRSHKHKWHLPVDSEVVHTGVLWMAPVALNL